MGLMRFIDLMFQMEAGSGPDQFKFINSLSRGLSFGPKIILSVMLQNKSHTI